MQEHSEYTKENELEILRYINFKLASLGQPYVKNKEYQAQEKQNSHAYIGDHFIEIAQNLIANYQERSRSLQNIICPVDIRINNFLEKYLADLNEEVPQLPTNTFVLDRAGLARKMSLPVKASSYQNNYVKSYRVIQGILHNPTNDRRTTVGTFHVVADGLPVPLDKKEVPRRCFLRLLKAACRADEDLLKLPFTAGEAEQAQLFVSSYLKPLVAPDIPGLMSKKLMEIRYFAPASLVSNLDFVETIFGNAGDPGLLENDAALDVETWSGHTGCIILAPHLSKLKKKDLGLPHKTEATERQLHDGMYYEDANELYNEGRPFKITCRDAAGVVVSILADNYFGYSKKEVKTQISYAANMMGLVEEEHAGGALVFPRSGLLEVSAFDLKDRSMAELRKILGSSVTWQEAGYAVDNNYADIIYLPSKVEFRLYRQEISWSYKQQVRKIKLLPKNRYILANGDQVYMEYNSVLNSWRLSHLEADKAMFCHKPFTVSGGGKSEISKSLANSIIYDFLYVGSLKEDFKMIDIVFNYDYRTRWLDKAKHNSDNSKFLDTDRTVGSAIKLLNQSSLYKPEYNKFIAELPNRIKILTLYIKRFYEPEWGTNWQQHFSVLKINGQQGHALRFNGKKIMTSYLRLGFEEDATGLIHKLRSDFIPAEKLQLEDDISSTITLDSKLLSGLEKNKYKNSVKLVQNCEYSFFQRPDDAVIRGYDAQAESDLAGANVFVSNYEPLDRQAVQECYEDAINFKDYTRAIQTLVEKFLESEEYEWMILPSHLRKLDDGTRSANPRYLQTRQDIVDPRSYYLAKRSIKLYRQHSLAEPLHIPVDAVLASRRNNPVNYAKGIVGLSVYNPIHYQSLPLLFMDFICSLSGKSPSTTGAGSEGALTKGPFNMLVPVSDLNNALLSFILTGHAGYSSVAGWVGSENRFDHDISMLMPELWCRLSPQQRNPAQLISEGSLEKVPDMEWEGQKILSSRLGYRITRRFVFNYLNRIFDEPHYVLSDSMLRPELQDMRAFAAGVNMIVSSQKRIAQMFFDDGSIEHAIPPLAAILHVMNRGNYRGLNLDDPDFLKLFNRTEVLGSSWYAERLQNKQNYDIKHWDRLYKYVESFIAKGEDAIWEDKLGLKARLKHCKKQLELAGNQEYLEFFKGSIGHDGLGLTK